MAAVLRKHVPTSAELGEDAEPPCADEKEENDSEGGSDDQMSEDGEGSDGDVDGGSDGEDAEDEDEGVGEEGGEGEDGGDGEESNANAGWAEAMAKILGKKTGKNQTIILSKNKELDKMKEEERQQQLEKKKQVDKKRAWEMLCRDKPDAVKDRETERALQRVATRGVVQLFNAVRKHQKTINDKVKVAGGSERKKAKILSSVSKKDFIDVLRTEGGSRATVKTEKDTAAVEEEKPAWSVLRDDYMMGATMKDWDKESDGDEAAAGGNESD